VSRDGVFIVGKVEGIRRKEKEKRRAKFVGRYDGRKVGGRGFTGSTAQNGINKTFYTKQTTLKGL